MSAETQNVAVFTKNIVALPCRNSREHDTSNLKMWPKRKKKEHHIENIRYFLNIRDSRDDVEMKQLHLIYSTLPSMFHDFPSNLFVQPLSPSTMSMLKLYGFSSWALEFSDAPWLFFGLCLVDDCKTESRQFLRKERSQKWLEKTFKTFESLKVHGMMSIAWVDGDMPGSAKNQDIHPRSNWYPLETLIQAWLNHAKANLNF